MLLHCSGCRKYQCSRRAVSDKPAVGHSIDFLVPDRTNASRRRHEMTVIIVNMLLHRTCCLSGLALQAVESAAKMIDWLKSRDVCVSSGTLLLYLQQVRWRRGLRPEGGTGNTGNRHFRAQPRERANGKRRILKFWAGFLALAALWRHLKLQGR